MKKAVVVGGGVIGLSAAFRLLENGWDVLIVAEKFTPETTSDGTAAFWEPYLSHPEDKILLWAKDSYKRFQDIQQHEMKSNPRFTGVHKTSGWEFSNDHIDFPRWMKEIVYHREAKPEEIPKDWTHGLYFETLIVESNFLMQYLISKIKQLGGRFQQRKIQNLSEIEEGYQNGAVVVNCSGLGARTLVPDDQVFPIAGHIVRIEAPWIKHFYSCTTLSQHKATETTPEENRTGIKKNDLIYIIPRSDCIVIGGTAHKNYYDTTPYPEVTQAILKRAEPLLLHEAKLSGYSNIPKYKIVKEWVGLRPGRTEIRLEPETLTNLDKNGKVRTMNVIHNYGHGGSGVTLSLGCAEEVVRLAEQQLAKSSETLQSKL